jgi:hypothetical protein
MEVFFDSMASEAELLSSLNSRVERSHLGPLLTNVGIIDRSTT